MQINRYTAIKYARDRLQDSNNQELEIGQQLLLIMVQSNTMW
jgi:hypothetical protein